MCVCVVGEGRQRSTHLHEPAETHAVIQGGEVCRGNVALLLSLVFSALLFHYIGQSSVCLRSS